MSRLGKILLAVVPTLIIATVAWAGYVNDGHDAQMVGGRDINGNPLTMMLNGGDGAVIISGPQAIGASIADINWQPPITGLQDSQARARIVRGNAFGDYVTEDLLDLAPALGAPTNTNLVATTSVKIGTVAASAGGSAENCYSFICGVDVNYRITSGASTALASDILLPAKTKNSFCVGITTQTDVTVYPSATLNNGCQFYALQTNP